MTAALGEPSAWPFRRWRAMIGMIFGVQLGLIFWLGGSAPSRPRPPAAGLTLHLAGQASAELRTLNDPTLFALPHLHGFSGPVWLRMPRPEFHPFEWAAPTNHLLLALDQLGTVFNQSVEASDFMPLQLPSLPEAVPTLPDVPSLAVSADQSVLQLAGDLAQRRLLAPLKLKSLPHPDILANSVVQVVVDAEGRPVSAILLSTSGSTEADQYALEQARAARFNPVGPDCAETVPNPTVHLCWGRMIFRWHTIPLTAASGAVVSP